MKLSHIILENMAYLPRNELGDMGIFRLKTELTIPNKFNPENTLILFDDSRKDYFGIPLYYWKTFQHVTDKVIDKRTHGKHIRFTMNTTPRSDQARVLTEFKEAITSGNTGFIVNAPPGWGKTRTLIEMIQMVGERALVVVPKSDLVEQWVERICEHTSMAATDIGIFSGGKAQYNPKKKITVGLVHTLALERFHQYRNDFGMIAFDEVHISVPPKTFSPVAQMYSAKYRIGASATLKRDDGWDKAFTYHVEQVKMVGDASTNRMSAEAYLINYPESSGILPHWVMHDKIKLRASLISLLAQNDKRNHFLASAAHASCASGRRTCVISDRTSILLDIYNILVKEMGYSPEDVGFYCSSLSSQAGVQLRTVTKKEQKKTAEKAKIILSTYGLMSTGTDIPDLAAILLATPQSKVTQTKGRVERVFSGKKQPVVMDVVDTYYEASQNWINKRLKEYKEAGMLIKNFHYSKFMGG